ncbi:PQQ-dependent sugar dehydrogenase [Actinocorallia longicatena]|uniref:PQQ-dependent sugar dehydrogenase n=1 Tax=Actinocorallia longicatena TaxID=111803 RepID=A0ABP6QKT1_9ACTN
MNYRRLSAAVATAGLLLAGCSAEKKPAPSAVPSTPAAPAPSSAASGGSAAAPGKVRLQEVGRVDQPTGMAVRKGDSALYVIEQQGRVRAIRDGRTVERPVLDIGGQISKGGERGLIGIAFSPDGRYLYLDATAPQGDVQVLEYRVAADGSVDAGSRRVVITQEHRENGNHNGGQLAFDEAGLLYIGIGDGGGAGDQHGNGQNLGTLLGKILRIDPRGGRPYKVPASNPFVSKAGARPEIWAYGLRNPWRFSFDSATGDLWIGDVGQNAYEEVDFQPAASKGGENYGWNAREGNHKFRSDAQVGVNPVLEYKLHEGNACSVIGGFVYRGEQLTNLTGRYLFADYCAGWVKALQLKNGKVTNQWRLLDGLDGITSFGQDSDGELYILTSDGAVSRLVGQ